MRYVFFIILFGLLMINCSDIENNHVQQINNKDYVIRKDTSKMESKEILEQLHILLEKDVVSLEELSKAEKLCMELKKDPKYLVNYYDKIITIYEKKNDFSSMKHYASEAVKIWDSDVSFLLANLKADICLQDSLEIETDSDKAIKECLKQKDYWNFAYIYLVKGKKNELINKLDSIDKENSIIDIDKIKFFVDTTNRYNLIHCW